MFGSVHVTCKVAAETWTSVPAFGEAFTMFGLCLTRIDEFAQKQAEISRSATEEMQHCRESMCEAAAAIAGAMRAYAISNNELELAGKVDPSRSALLAGRDRVSAERCQTIHRLASEKVADLAEHGVTAAKLKSLQVKIDAYSACLQRPRQIITESKTTTAQMEAEIATANQLLVDGLDRLVLQFKDAAPEFYANYTNARVVVHNAAGRDIGTSTPQPQPKAT